MRTASSRSTSRCGRPRTRSGPATGSASRCRAAPTRLFCRNTGTGEPMATGANLRSADQEVFHDAARPSCHRAARRAAPARRAARGTRRRVARTPSTSLPRMTQPTFVPIAEADQVRPARHLHVPGPWTASRPAEVVGPVQPAGPRHGDAGTRLGLRPAVGPALRARAEAGRGRVGARRPARRGAHRRQAVRPLRAGTRASTTCNSASTCGASSTPRHPSSSHHAVRCSPPSPTTTSHSASSSTPFPRRSSG